MTKFEILKHFAQIAPVYRRVRTLDPEPISYIEFEYPRTSTIDELVKKAFAKHYSTFYLYRDDEHIQAIEVFKENLLKHYQSDLIYYTDENTLIALRKIK